MEVLVFKTNLGSAQSVNDISPRLDQHPDIQRWNVDLHDCDYVLRIETVQLQARDVERMLSIAGYYCEELE